MSGLSCFKVVFIDDLLRKTCLTMGRVRFAFHTQVEPAHYVRNRELVILEGNSMFDTKIEPLLCMIMLAYVLIYSNYFLMCLDDAIKIISCI